MFQGYLLPSAPPTSSVSTSLGHAGGTSAGRSKKNSIAFGMLPLWTSTRVNEGSLCRTRSSWVAGSGACAGSRPPPDYVLESVRFLGQSGLRIRLGGKG